MFKKNLILIFIYQIIFTQLIYSSEFERKEKLEDFCCEVQEDCIKKMKERIPRKYFDKYTREELKFILLTLYDVNNLQNLERNFKKPVSKDEEYLSSKLYHATENNNYEEVLSILIETRADPHMDFDNRAMCPFTLATSYSYINIVKLFVWHSGYSFESINTFHSVHLDDHNFPEIPETYNQLYYFMQNYAPKIARIKNENMLPKINEFIANQLEKKTNLPKELCKLIAPYSFYPESFPEQVKLTYEEIDEIIEIYDTEFNVNNEFYKNAIRLIEKESKERTDRIEFAKCCIIM